jgi:hypothetical protein
MRVLCINTKDESESAQRITVGVWYDTKLEDGVLYRLKENDDGRPSRYQFKWFITEQEHRSNTINQVLYGEEV